MPLSKILGRKEKFPTPEELKERGVKSNELVKDLSGNPYPSGRIPEAPAAPGASLFDKPVEIDTTRTESFRPKSTDEIQRVIELVLEDKLHDFSRQIEHVRKVREDVRYLSKQLDEQFERLNNRLHSLEVTFDEGLSERDETINKVAVELKALQMVFDDILPELTEKIKESKN